MKNDLVNKLNLYLDKEVEKNESYTNSMMVFVVEVDQNGRPLGVLNKVLAPPFTALGMYDYAKETLEKMRDGIYDQLVKEQNDNSLPSTVQEMYNKLPKGIHKILEKYHDELKEALESGDGEALERIKSKIFKEWSDLDDNSDNPDDFDIEDFIGGSI